MGTLTARVSEPQRRDRLLLVCALATFILTSIGEASELIGLNKSIKSNTSKKRTHSLFCQGMILFAIIIMSSGDTFFKLIVVFNDILDKHSLLLLGTGVS